MKTNVNSATNNFLNTINSVLNKYAPLKKINRCKLRFSKKPWITSVFKNQSILRTNY